MLESLRPAPSSPARHAGQADRRDRLRSRTCLASTRRLIHGSRPPLTSFPTRRRRRPPRSSSSWRSTASTALDFDSMQDCAQRSIERGRVRSTNGRCTLRRLALHALGGGVRRNVPAAERELHRSRSVCIDVDERRRAREVSASRRQPGHRGGVSGSPPMRPSAHAERALARGLRDRARAVSPDSVLDRVSSGSLAAGSRRRRRSWIPPSRSRGCRTTPRASPGISAAARSRRAPRAT